MSEIQKYEEQNSNISREYAGEDLKNGTYWTCLKDVTREGKELGFYKGEVILLADTPTVDNAIHHVIMMIHPSHWSQMSQWQDKHIKLTMAEFYEFFEYCADGEKVRAEEIAKAQGKIKTLQEEVVEASSNPQKVLGYLETSEDEELKGYREQLEFRAGLPSPDSELKNVEHTSMMSIQLNNQRIAAEATSVVIKKISDEITQNVATVGHYYGEVAEASLSKVSGAIAYAKEITNKLETLDIYLGKDVTVDTVTTGKSAPAESKYNVYQDLIYMDEESLINHARGGADYNDVTEFFEKLKSDEQLRNRIFPMERTIVAIRPRRSTKRYGECPITNIILNQLNAECFIMVRNGENIHAIYSPMKQTPHLFPTRDQMDKPFIGLDGRNITKEDLDYVDSRDKADNLTTHYKRLLLLLQGVYERDLDGEVFGELPAEKGEKVLLLNPVMQERCFNFISEENQLGDSRKDYIEWFSEVNSDVTFGSRVLIDQNAIGINNCPGIYSNSMYHESQQVVDLNCDQFNKPFIIKRNKGKMMFQVKGVSTGYDSKGLERNYWVDFEALLNQHHNSSPDYICLDKIYSGDIEFYINSRMNRKHYRRYIGMLLKAQNEIDIFESEHKELFDSASEIIRGKSDTVNVRALWAAISTRCSGKGGKTLSVSTDLGKVLNIYWQNTADTSSVVEEITSLSSEIVAITTNDLGEYFAHSILNDSCGFSWLEMSKVIFEGSKPKALDAQTKIIRASEIKVADKVVYGEDDLEKIKEKQDSAHRLTYRQFKNRLKQIKEGETKSYKYLQIVNDELSKPDANHEQIVDKMIEDWTRFHYEIETKNRTIDVPVISFPLGFTQRDSGQIYTVCASIEYEELAKGIILQHADKIDANACLEKLYNTVRRHTNHVYPKSILGQKEARAAMLTIYPIDEKFAAVQNLYADASKVINVQSEDTFHSAIGKIDRLAFTKEALNNLEYVSKYLKITIDGRNGENFSVEEFLSSTK